MGNKFIGVQQKDSGGYSIADTTLGIGEYMIFEVNDDFNVQDHLLRLDEQYKGDLFEYCECCGEREIGCKSDVIKWVNNNYNQKGIYDMNETYIHFINGVFCKASLCADVSIPNVYESFNKSKLF